MLDLFVIGMFWFWALLAFEAIVLFAFVEYENGVFKSIYYNISSYPAYCRLVGYRTT